MFYENDILDGNIDGIDDRSKTFFESLATATFTKYPFPAPLCE